MIPPLLIEAAKDRQLHGAPIHILVYLHGQLAYTEFRSVKRWLLADEIGFSPRQVTRALALLVDQGYLRQGDRQKAKVGSYILLPSRGEVAKQKSAA